MSDDAHALLDRLVGQFASPYDFLRELVQNAMDAGSDLVEVELHQHAGEHPAEVVFELVVVDAGRGMDEEIIDGELTRLFATSKTDDRTMAGGFGIGFVSVFAWEPERVLVQTGRQGDAWEVMFREDRRFEKHRVDVPLEGTTVRLFRRGAPSQRVAIADAVEDALTRWCRFAPIEVTFEDIESGRGPRLLEAPFEPEDLAASVRWENGPSRAVLGFGAADDAVLMRRGLVLEEGRSTELLPELKEAAGASTMEHLVVRLDSPRLHTGMARDGVVLSEERRALERELRPSLGQLRDALARRLAEVAGRASWDEATAQVYTHLHAHLMLEHDNIGELGRRPLLRLATGAAVSMATLQQRARRGLVCVADQGALELRVLALRSGVPVLQGRWDRDRPWLEALLGRVGVEVRALEQAVSRVQPRETPEGLARLTLSLLPPSHRPAALRWGALDDAPPHVLGGPAFAEGGVVTGVMWRGELLHGHPLWLSADHPLVQRAQSTAVSRPEVAALGLAFAILSRSDRPDDPLVDTWRRFG